MAVEVAIVPALMSVTPPSANVTAAVRPFRFAFCVTLLVVTDVSVLVFVVDVVDVIVILVDVAAVELTLLVVDVSV